MDRNVHIANCVSHSGARLPLSRLLAYILAAGGPPDQLANVRWPLHKALHELLEAAGRSGERELIGVALTLRPSADGGFAVEGADEAIQALVQWSVLEVQGELREARLVLNEDAGVRLRRELMLLPPEQVAFYRRVGVRWAALASTAAKNRSIALRSSAATVASSIPNRA